MSDRSDRILFDARCLRGSPERDEWLASGLVEVQSLRKGDVFEAQSGLLYMFERQELNGTCHAAPWGHKDGPAHTISRCMVRPVMRTQYVEPKEHA